MQIKQLKYVQEIACHKSITRAADKLYISRQALSESVRLLEDELGFTIFERSNKGVVPTQEGKIFLKDLEMILSVMESWTELSEKNRSKRKVRILVQYIISDYILNPQFLKKLNALPDIEVEIEAVSGDDILKVVETDEDSIGIMLPAVNGKVKPRMFEMREEEKIAVETLAEVKQCIVLAKENLLCKKEQLFLSDLMGMELAQTKVSAKSIPFQKITSATNKNGYILPTTTDLLTFVAKQENIITFLPKMIAEDNIYVKNGLLEVRALADYDETNAICYLVYHKKQMEKSDTLLMEIRNYFV